MRHVLALTTLMMLLGPAPVRADGCSELWYSRNRIYKGAGYCFKTGRAIAAFGNAGCRLDEIEDVPLSARDRAVVGRIAREEASLGCRP